MTWTERSRRRRSVYAPEVFGGFEETDKGIKLATAEKALFDFAYLSAGRSRLFTTLSELELPRRFRKSELRHWLARIPSARSRALTDSRLAAFLGQARKSPTSRRRRLDIGAPGGKLGRCTALHRGSAAFFRGMTDLSYNDR